MATATTRLGVNGILSHSVTGQGGTFTTLTNCKDLTLNLEKGEADASTRVGGGYKATVGTLFDASIEWEMVQDYADTGFGVIRDAFLNRTLIGLKCLDKTSGEGLKGDFEILKFTRGEPIDGIQTVQVVAKPTYSSTPPSWVTGT